MTTIVMPVYNRPNALREALRSLMAQTCNKFFVVVVDDNSNEPIKEVVDEFENFLHIKYIKKSANEGPGKARQEGLQWCYDNNIEFVMFMDSDDALFPNAVQRLVHEIKINSCDMVSSEIRVEDKDGTIHDISSDNKTWLHGKIFRVSFLQKHNLMFGETKTNEDLSFLLRFHSLSPKFGRLEEEYYLFRNNAESLTRNKKADDYFMVRSTDYIEAIYETVIFISERKLPFAQNILNNIFVCYNYYQKALILNTPKLEKIKSLLQYLYSIPEITDMLSSDISLNGVSTNLKQGEAIGTKFYWFKQTFEQFLEELAQ